MKDFLRIRTRLQRHIRRMVVRYLSFVRLDEYGDPDDLTTDILAELFAGPVDEICTEAFDAWNKTEQL